LTLAHTIPANFGNVAGSNNDGMAFDRAGNLYVVSTAGERLGVWSLPKAENRFTTFSQSFEGPTGIDPVQTINKNERLRVYPNPVVSGLTIEGTGIKPESYTIYEVNGRAVRSGKADTQPVRLNVSDLNPGIYILQVKTAEGVITKRIIKTNI
jgi:hypothetical protein